jgi:uncharacterized membrane protein
MDTVDRKKDEKGAKTTVAMGEYRDTIRKLIGDEVRAAFDEEVRKAEQELIEEQRKAVRQILEEHKVAIRQIVEEEKKSIWEKAEALRKSILNLGL